MKFLAVILAAGILTGLEVKAQPQLADAIEAVVHDSVITKYEIYRETELVMERISEQYRGQPDMIEKKRRDLETEALDRRVEEQLILHEFETAGYSLPDTVIDEFVQQSIRRNYTDRATLAQTLQARGMTFEKLRKQFRDEFIIGQMRLKNISDVVLISPHKIETYYVTHTNDFKMEEQIKLRMIVLNKKAEDNGQARKLADEILTRIKEGSSFEEMARGYSEGLHSSQGGDWDWIKRSVLRKELDDAAFALKPGEKSGVIETPEACYIMLVEDKKAEHVRPLSEVHGEIESKLLSEEQDRLRKQWVERLKKKTFIRLFLQD